MVDGAGLAEVRVQLNLYRRILAARLRSDWQYRTSFLLMLTSQAVASGLDLAAIVVIFGRVHALAGWSVVQVGLLYGIAGVAFGIGDVFVSQVEEASRHIKAGTFDRFLLRPVWPLLQLSADEFALRRVGKLLQPAAVLVIAVAGARIRWSAARAVLLPVSLASGVVIFGAIWVITSSVAFWTVETQEFGNAFTYGGNHLTQYPIDVLGAWLRRLATFLVPLAFVAYYPASYLLGKGTGVGLAFLSPAVAATLALVAATVWRNAIRHYRSTGS